MLASYICALALGGPPVSALDREQLEPVYERLKSDYDAAEGPATLQPYLTAAEQLGTLYMTAPDLDSKTKYPAALRYYREVVALDDRPRLASQNIAMIEEIYRSLDRPIPE